MRSIENPMKAQAEHYADLVTERAESPCTAEEQAGEDATQCPKCKRKEPYTSTRRFVGLVWLPTFPHNSAI